MNEYFNIAKSLIKENKTILKNLLSKQTSYENACYIADEIKLDNDIYISLNKEYKKGRHISDFVKDENMHDDIKKIFDMNLYIHQEKALKSIQNLHNTIISTGTGSGKTESFIIPIIDYCIKNSDKKGVKAIIIYPMNALANDQKRRISEILSKTNIKFGIFTGETPSKYDDEIKNNVDLYNNQIVYREDILEELPDILITNHVMLDRILTHKENVNIIINSTKTIKFVALDEIHIYKGNKGAHLKFLLDRLRYNISNELVHIGCSATLSYSDENQSSNGYLQGNNIDFFIKPLFNSNKYNLIEAEYEKLRPLPKNIKNYDEINLIKENLYQKSYGILDIINLLNENNYKYNKKQVYDLLNESSNVISFRTNLFLMDTKGGVKKCIKCSKYFVGTSKNCMSCSSPLLNISTKDPNMMVGVLNDKKVNHNINVFSENDVYVGIVDSNYKTNDNYHTININENVFFDRDNNINVDADKEGKLKLVYLDKKPEIFDLKREYGFLNTTKTILRNTNNKKMITFIDNRKEVSKNKNLFNDNCVDETFHQIAKFVTGSKKVSIVNLYNDLKCEIEEYVEKNNSNKKFIEAFKEFDVWYERFIRSKETDLKINLINNSNLSAHEVDVLEFMIKYKVIDINLDKINTNTKYLNYNLYTLKKVPVVTTKKDEIKDSKYYKISLSDRGFNIKDFFKEKYNETVSITDCDFEKILESLYMKDYLNKIEFEKNIYGYNIKRNSLMIEFDECNYNTITDIISNNFYISETHSSEVEKNKKSKIEKDFQESKINIMFSTPTLEMGIDIGGLNIVFMKGVPPSPSNFAQRAGRAGRSSDKTALIVTLCSDGSYHDMYYFQNPIKMIEGVINPPKFQDNNMNLAKKHINALLYKMSDVSNKQKIIDNLIKCFNTLDKDEIEKYINNLDINKLKQQTPKHLYNKNIFPDYSFRRDEVKVYDIEALRYKDKDKKQFELSSREPEVAYREYIPEKITYMSGEIMRFADLDVGYENIDGVRVYKEIYAKKDNGYILKDDKEDIYDTCEYISYAIDNKGDRINLENLLDGNILQIIYSEDVKLCFFNNGSKTTGMFKSKTTKEEYTIGQILKRQALLIKAEHKLLSEDLMVNLVALLVSSIKALYGLDDSELNILYDKNQNLFALYDTNGNKNIDLNKIYKNINQIIEYGYNKVKKCKCNSPNGCYLCLKSYDTNKYAQLLDKEYAYKIGGYLIGKNRLPVKPFIKSDNNDCFDLNINVVLKNNNLEISYKDNKILKSLYNKSQNEIIFDSLIDIFKEINDDNIEYIKITTKLDYLVDIINNKSKARKSVENYKLFKFMSLKFRQIVAVKG